MLIKGFQKFTVLDYPGKAAATVFLFGCNFRCGFCHNKDLVLPECKDNLETYSEEEILDYLKQNKDFLDGLVITGGEPTVSEKLPDFLKKIKEIGLCIKLDTNGSNPEMLKKLIDEKLIDFVAMDFKTDFENYHKVASNLDINKLKESINLIKNLENYEFRTTVVSGFVVKENLIKIASFLKKEEANKKFVLQQFVPRNCIDPKFLKLKRTEEKELKELKESIKDFFEKIEIRTE